MDAASEYQESSEFQKRDAAEVIEEFADEIAEMKGRCIDIGCGPGNVTRDFFLPRLPLDAEVVGADISKKMIEFATTEHIDEKRLSFVDLNIEAEELPPDQIEAYDNAVSFYCLHWCKSLRKASENIFKLLRPGGHALLLFLAHYDNLASYLRMREKPRYRPYMEDVENFIPLFQSTNCPREKYKEILRDAGFDVLHCSVREKSFVFKNKIVMKKHNWAVNPFIYRMPEDMRDQFVNELVEDAIKSSISFTNSTNDNASQDERSVLAKYFLMLAYIKKPVS